MRAIFVAIAVLALVACTGGESTTSGATGAAGSSSEDATGAAVDAVGKAMQAATDPKVAGCIQKVKEGAFAEAYSLCLEAAKIDPDNNEVTAALEKSKEAYTEMADAAKQGSAAMDAAKKGIDMPKSPY